MDLVNLAVAVVFISNAIILILLVYMLFRILGQTEHTRFMMVSAARELNDSARVVRDAGYRVAEVLKGGGGAGSGSAGITPTPVTGIEMLDKLNHMMEEISSKQHTESTDEALGDLKRLMEGLAALDGHQAGEWQRKHKAELEHALAQRDKLARETEEMRRRLHEAHRIIIELRKANKAAEAMGHTVEHLRTEMGKQQQVLERAKERLHKAEAKAEELSADVERLSAANPEGAADNEALKEARRRLQEVSAERDARVRELEGVKGEMQRTLVEKEFIEEHFLRLDSSRRRATADLGDDGAAGDVAPSARQNRELTPA